ncbi:MAG: MmgE/PrpD family protein [Hyphomicrobiales bacterium]|nr:MmgE/PrpD family protein [Hyphomicrobiales bacterium]
MDYSEMTPLDAGQLSELCRWAAGLDAAAIPRAVMAQAANILCDDLAAIVSARNDPVLAKVREQFLRDGGKGAATVFDGGARRTDRYTAALVNGAAAPWNELDEGFRLVPCHAGIYALPALLAEAEAEGITTEETLRALIAAYEVATRFALTFPQSALNLHPHAAFAAIGASAAVAAARGYDEGLFLSTLTTAATLVNPGPFDHAVRGSFARNMWVAHGAWVGLKAADWAACGVSGLADGPRTVFSDILDTEFDPGQLSAGLGKDWLILQSFQKIYPCCQYAHSMIDAMAEILPGLPSDFSVRNCEAITVEIHRRGCRLNEYNPSTVLAARFSVPHIAAVMAVRGRIDTDTLGSDSLTDPEVAELRRRVVIRRYEPELRPPNDRSARVTLRFLDGAEFRGECLCARGSPTTPLGPTAIRQKINDICESVYPGLARMMDRLSGLNEADLLAPWPDSVQAIVSKRNMR